MKNPKYRTIIVTDFELSMLESIPEYKLGTDSQTWKAANVLKRILKGINSKTMNLQCIATSPNPKHKLTSP